ncbi:D-beta-hydroxybutyrate dehydrogenase [hydrothermal vent metagenome]|uniref:D-beta-hydroxybutyrate dehydrogenase n=1 Tax=hydrothermal vent metagenome TaxID=652676 RepID=A0A3B0U4Y9_9ZZZZ
MAKAVLITGSTSGIGLVIAKRFLESGYNVGLNSFEPEAEIKAALNEVKETGISQTGSGTESGQTESGQVKYFQADLAYNNGVELVENFVKSFGRIDVLINNAGVQKVAPIDEFETSDWEKVRAVGLDAAYQTIKSAVPVMKSQQWGRIINIASVHGLVASPFKSAYVAAKHGLLGLTKTVALEVAQSGVTVNAICPGYVLTPLVEKQIEDQAKVHGISRDEVVKTIMLAPQPTGKFVTPAEVAELALYLTSDMARSITGTSIAVDGGWTAR